jgi:hypothetical protein
MGQQEQDIGGRARNGGIRCAITHYEQLDVRIEWLNVIICFGQE